MERFSSLVTKSRPWPVIGRTIFFTSDKNRPTRDEIYFIDFWRENLSMYRIKHFSKIKIEGSSVTVSRSQHVHKRHYLVKIEQNLNKQFYVWLNSEYSLPVV